VTPEPYTTLPEVTDRPDSPQGRGILLDYARWAASQTPPITYSTFSTHGITFSAILAMCKHHNVTPREGDILFIRIGVMPEWEAFSEPQKIEYAAQKEPSHAGVEASIELLQWLWDSKIAAVAGDAISWEV
jgi:kynurenine formamidase